jgi:hypothetical protein
MLEEKLYASKMNAHKTTLEEISNASKMNALQTKDRNVLGGKNYHQPESPKTAAEKAGFEPGDEGGPGRGNKTGGQNDHAFKKSRQRPSKLASKLVSPRRLFGGVSSRGIRQPKWSEATRSK